MRTRNPFRICAAAFVAAAAIASASDPALAGDPPSEETIAYFRQNCVSCHTIGGGALAGPDLKDAAKRRTREQLVKFVIDPKAAIDAGDPYLVKLWNDARGVFMPAPPGITADRAGKLVDLIEAESALEKSRFAGTSLSDRPLTAADVAAGESAFTGATALSAGGPPCLACHTVEGSGGFGGGRLGPDLTDVFARLGGRKPLAAWLASPQSPTMAPVFASAPLSEAEVLGLVAYLQDREVKAAGRKAGGAGAFEFLACGAGGLLALLALLDFAWRRRHVAVRRPMVEGR